VVSPIIIRFHISRRFGAGTIDNSRALCKKAKSRGLKFGYLTYISTLLSFKGVFGGLEFFVNTDSGSERTPKLKQILQRKLEVPSH